MARTNAQIAAYAYLKIVEEINAYGILCYDDTMKAIDNVIWILTSMHKDEMGLLERAKAAEAASEEGR